MTVSKGKDSKIPRVKAAQMFAHIMLSVKTGCLRKNRIYRISADFFLVKKVMGVGRRRGVTILSILYGCVDEIHPILLLVLLTYLAPR